MFLQGLNNGQNPVALNKKHPVCGAKYQSSTGMWWVGLILTIIDSISFLNAVPMFHIHVTVSAATPLLSDSIEILNIRRTINLH